MKTYEITFRVSVPDDVSDHDAREWIRFELHDNGECSNENPLVDRDLEPNRGTVRIHFTGASA